VICLEKPGSLLERMRRLAAAGTDDGFSLTTCAGDYDSILWLAKGLRPVVVVIEEPEAEKLGVEKLQKALPLGSLHTLIVFKGQDSATLEHYLRLGCSGAIVQAAPDETFRKAIQAIFDGEIWVPRKVLTRVVQSLLFGDPGRRLTRREIEVLKRICLGSTNQQIADELFISRETVRWHVRSLYSKIGAKDRDSAIRYAIGLGIQDGNRTNLE
jgi:DNA-binding NarL/FixJ family response regulator